MYFSLLRIGASGKKRIDRRGMRAVEYYGYALIAGIGHDEAAGMLPGYILDMYMIRLRYDARLAGANMEKRAFG